MSTNWPRGSPISFGAACPTTSCSILAARGKLRENLDRQVRRMLGDAKSKALVENFAGQWLQLRNLDLAAPDKSQFPAFDDDLRRAMRTESEMFFAAIVREDRSVLELLDADYHVRQCAARAALRAGRRRGRPVPPGIAPGRGRRRERPRRRAHAGRGAHGDVESHADLARQTRQVGAWRTSSARRRPIRRRMFPCCGTTPRPWPPARCGSGWSSTARTPTAPCATRKWTPWASPWRTSTPWGPGGPRTASSRSTPPRSCPTAGRSTARGN